MPTIARNMVSVRLVNAVERTWRHIRKHHPDVPPVVITIGSGTADPKHQRLGHFAAARWEYDNSQVSELFIAGEGLQKGATATLATLLHEAAHGLAVARGIKDTSRQGRYHNTKYKTLAEELGLTVTEADKIGWSATTLPNTTLSTYSRYVGVLERALVIWRRTETQKLTRASNNNGITAHCECSRRIRVAQTVYDQGPITCGLCDTPFETEDS